MTSSELLSARHHSGIKLSFNCHKSLLRLPKNSIEYCYFLALSALSGGDAKIIIHPIYNDYK